MTIRKIIYSFATAILIGVAVTSCISNDEEQYAPDNGEPKTISLSLSATPYGKDTRAVFPEHQAEANELIQEWFVAIVDESGDVVAVEQGTNVGGAWNDVVNVELELYKKYTAFAFANFNNTNSEADSSEAFAVKLGLSDGKKVNIQGLIENAIFSGAADKDYLSSKELIPMAGYLEFTPRGTVNETFAIEVVRLYSRVEFAFVKNATDNISITEIALQPVNTGSVFLMPNYGEKPIPDNNYPANAPILPNGVKYQPITLGNLNIIVPPDANADISERYRFYIKESIAEGNHPTDHFHIGITLKRDNQQDENLTYALADDKLEFFYRNDYVLFPIVISDYTPILNVYDYPPIGGYPVNVESRGTEFYATFSSSGAFDIEAKLLDSSGNELTVDDTPLADKTYNIECIYDKNLYPGLNLTYDPVTRRWNGYFELGAENKVNEPIVVTFTFTINDLTYTRTLYLLSSSPNQ